MQVLKIDPKNPDIDVLIRISEEIKSGKLVAYHTDTIYGLCTNPFDKEAVIKLYKLKERDLLKGLPILIDGIKTLNKIAFLDEKLIEILDRFWPGPLTLILPKKDVIEDYVTGKTKTIAVRQPFSLIANNLAKFLGGFVIGTSANKSGSIIPPTSAKQVIKEFGNKIDFILDGGKTQSSKPSTIIDCTKEHPIIIREGVISKNELKKFFN